MFEYHLPAEPLEAGVKSGIFLSGTLNVNRFKAQSEAYVKIGDRLGIQVSANCCVVHCIRQKTV